MLAATSAAQKFYEEALQLRVASQLAARQEEAQSLLLKALAVDPKFPAALADLSRGLVPGTPIKLPDGRAMTAEQLNLEAILLDPDFAPAHCNLGRGLRRDGSVTLPNHHIATRRELFLAAVAKDPTHADALAFLSGCLKKADDRIGLPDGSTWTAEALDVAALRFNPRCGKALCNIASRLMRLGTPLPAMDSDCLSTCASPRALFLRAIDADPFLAEAYAGLSQCLSPGTSAVKLADGREMTSQQLNTVAIECNPHCAEAYLYLALSLPQGETVLVPSKRVDVVWGQRALIVEALWQDPTDPFAYECLARQMNSVEVVRLHDGRIMTQQEVLGFALSLDPHRSSLYEACAACMSPFEAITLADGRVMTQRTLYVTAIHLDPHRPEAYEGLAVCLSRHDNEKEESDDEEATVKLMDGQVMTASSLLDAAAAIRNASGKAPDTANAPGHLKKKHLEFDGPCFEMTAEAVTVSVDPVTTPEGAVATEIRFGSQSTCAIPVSARLANISDADLQRVPLLATTRCDEPLHCAIERRPSDGKRWIVVPVDRYRAVMTLSGIVSLEPDNGLPFLDRRHLDGFAALALRLHDRSPTAAPDDDSVLAARAVRFIEEQLGYCSIVLRWTFGQKDASVLKLEGLPRECVEMLRFGAEWIIPGVGRVTLPGLDGAASGEFRGPVETVPFFRLARDSDASLDVGLVLPDADDLEDIGEDVDDELHSKPPISYAEGVMIPLCRSVAGVTDDSWILLIGQYGGVAVSMAGSVHGRRCIVCKNDADATVVWGLNRRILIRHTNNATLTHSCLLDLPT